MASQNSYRLLRPPRQTGNWDTDSREFYKWLDRVWFILGGPVPGPGVPVSSLNFNNVTVTGNTELNVLNTTVYCDPSGGDFTVTLPDASNFRSMIEIKHIAASGTVTIDSNGGDIDGEASHELYAYETMTFQSDQTDWWIV